MSYISDSERIEELETKVESLIEVNKTFSQLFKDSFEIQKAKIPSDLGLTQFCLHLADQQNAILRVLVSLPAAGDAEARNKFRAELEKGQPAMDQLQAQVRDMIAGQIPPEISVQ